MFKSITRLARGAVSSPQCKVNSMMMGPALLLTSMRTSTGGTKGAPPISIDDLYGLCFLAEPSVRPPVEREPRPMFDTDIGLNEVVIYLNGGLHSCNDKVSEDFVLHMFEASLVSIITSTPYPPYPLISIYIDYAYSHLITFSQPLIKKNILQPFIEQNNIIINSIRSITNHNNTP